MTSQIRDHMCFLDILILDQLYCPKKIKKKPLLFWVVQPISIEYWDLMLTTSFVFVDVTVRVKFGLVRLPYSLFTMLVLLVFIELLGDRSCDLTSGTVGVL